MWIHGPVFLELATLKFRRLLIKASFILSFAHMKTLFLDTRSPVPSLSPVPGFAMDNTNIRAFRLHIAHSTQPCGGRL